MQNSNSRIALDAPVGASTSSIIRAAFLLSQEDGTLEPLLGETTALIDMLEALCGVTRPKEGDPEVRTSLAESIEMLVSLCCLPLCLPSRRLNVLFLMCRDQAALLLV